MQRPIYFNTVGTMHYFRTMDERFQKLIDRISTRHFTAMIFVAIAVTSYLQPSKSAILSVWDYFPYGRLFYSCWLIVGAVLIWLVDDPFAFFVGTLPFVAFVVLSIVVAPSTGSYYPIALLTGSFLWLVKSLMYEYRNR